MKPKKPSVHYATNKELMEEIEKYKSTCQFDPDGNYIEGSARMSDKLARLIVKIVQGYSQRANFCGYSWLPDMQGDAYLVITKYLRSFDPNKSNNPFSYISQMIFHAFISHITNQKNHSKIKNQLFSAKSTFAVDSDISIGGEKAINYTLLNVPFDPDLDMNESSSWEKEESFD